MDQEHEKKLEKSLYGVQRGEYWCGIMFRMGMLIAVLAFLPAVFFIFVAMAKGNILDAKFYASAVAGINWAIGAYACKILRDAFRSIQLMADELKQII